eukprot:NODE_197_length_15379_cov_0.485602.p12 type:complete len:101 gc:universal NODE_197_length_15379_cov_0.485602:12424-12122(-)
MDQMSYRCLFHINHGSLLAPYVFETTISHLYGTSMIVFLILVPLNIAAMSFVDSKRQKTTFLHLIFGMSPDCRTERGASVENNWVPNEHSLGSKVVFCVS